MVVDFITLGELSTVTCIRTTNHPLLFPSGNVGGTTADSGKGCNFSFRNGFDHDKPITSDLPIRSTDSMQMHFSIRVILRAVNVVSNAVFSFNFSLHF